MATSPSNAADDDALTYEETHVHSVYESIASHFSSTRYKPWPVVDTFLRELTPGSIGLDVGCGNGKYLNVNKDVFITGSDRSSNLIALAAQHQTSQPQPNGAIPNRSNINADVLIADTLSLPHPNHSFDFAICIAVIHHLSSRQRRIAAIRGILKTLTLASQSNNQPGPGHPPSQGQSETTPAAHHVSLAIPFTASNFHPGPDLDPGPPGPPTQSQGDYYVPGPDPQLGSAYASAADTADWTIATATAAATVNSPRSVAAVAAEASGSIVASAITDPNSKTDLRDAHAPPTGVQPHECAPQAIADPAASALPAGLADKGNLYADTVEGVEPGPGLGPGHRSGQDQGQGGNEAGSGRNSGGVSVRDWPAVRGTVGAESSPQVISSERAEMDGAGLGGDDVGSNVGGAATTPISLPQHHHHQHHQQQQQQQKDVDLPQGNSNSTLGTRFSGIRSKAGQALLFVWALEQQGSRRGWKEGDEQDVLVPWVLKGERTKGQKKGQKKEQKQKQSQAQNQNQQQQQEQQPTCRETTETATHGSASGPEMSHAAGHKMANDENNPHRSIINNDNDKDKDNNPNPNEPQPDNKAQVFGRFYHLYAQGELEAECEAAGARVVRSGYDRDNWWVVVVENGELR